MLITKEVDVCVGKNKSHYLEKGYLGIKKGDKIKVKTEDLADSSKVIVEVKCEYCEKKLNIQYIKHYANTKTYPKFACSTKCMALRRKEYTGFEYSNQNPEIKEKTFNNLLKEAVKYDNKLLIETYDYMKYVITKEVVLTINKLNIKHLTELGYINLIENRKIIIPVEHLMDQSSIRIDCKCSECDIITNLSKQKFLMNYNRGGFYTCTKCNNKSLKISMIEKYGVDNCSKYESSIKKRKDTCITKYGNEYVINSNYSKQKKKETCLIRYGVPHHMFLSDISSKGKDKMIKTKIEKGLCIDPINLTEWEIYERKTRSLTNSLRKKLLNDWDGYDFYDNEYILDYFDLDSNDPKYPCIDHKISIFNGFLENIDYNIIGGVDNLCITKRKYNATKSSKNYDVFIEQLKKAED